MRERGQVTIEAMLIVGMFMVLLVTVSYPLAWNSKTYAREVSIVGDARFVTDQIANAANSIVHPDEKRTIDVYVPAFNSPDTSIPVSITTDGNKLNATISIPGSAKTLSSELYGTGWAMFNGANGSEAGISETSGERYTITITWKNITYWRQ